MLADNLHVLSPQFSLETKPSYEISNKSDDVLLSHHRTLNFQPITSSVEKTALVGLCTRPLCLHVSDLHVATSVSVESIPFYSLLYQYRY